jgi:tryptophan synthase alpha chain
MFLNAGDPPLNVLRDLVHMLDGCQVDCLELAVAFPDSPTDGPVIRRSARRALEHGVGLDEVLNFLDDIRPGLKHLKVALLADWSYTVKPMGLADFLARVQHSGSDGLLVHGLPPRLRSGYYETADRLGLPIVTTCYANSAVGVLAEAGRHASAYLYLVSRYGRTGTGPATDYPALSGVLTTLRTMTRARIATGFGVATRADVAAMRAVGADAVVVGSAAVSRVESALAGGRNVVDALYEFLDDLRPGLLSPSGHASTSCTTS